MKDDMQTTNMYAKRTGIAGDTLRQSHGALPLISMTLQKRWIYEGAIRKDKKQSGR